MKYDSSWAAEKLDMKRRRLDLIHYIDTYLPELKSKPGLVIDIGCGPGDFLGLCKDLKHTVLGIDAPNGKGGMGESYLKLCRERRKEFGVPVNEYGIRGFFRDAALISKFAGKAVCINMRGSIEQCFSDYMVGPSHDLHHDCHLLNWNKGTAPTWFTLLMETVATLLRPGGVLLIHANGTKDSDEWYDNAIQEAAFGAELVLVKHVPPVLHKWEKT